MGMINIEEKQTAVWTFPSQHNVTMKTEDHRT